MTGGGVPCYTSSLTDDEAAAVAAASSSSSSSSSFSDYREMLHLASLPAAPSSSSSSSSGYPAVVNPNAGSLPLQLARPTTAADRKAKRRAQNRASQKAFRQRKAEQESQMNQRYSDLAARCERLEDENTHLRQLLDRNRQHGLSELDGQRSNTTWQEASGLVRHAMDAGQSASPLSASLPDTPESPLSIKALRHSHAPLPSVLKETSAVAKPEPIDDDCLLEAASHVTVPDQTAKTNEDDVLNCLGLSLMGGMQSDMPLQLDGQPSAIPDVDFQTLNEQYALGQTATGAASALTPNPFMQQAGWSASAQQQLDGVQHAQDHTRKKSGESAPQPTLTIARRRGHTLPSLYGS